MTNVARKQADEVRDSLKDSLASRIREIRREVYGEHGGPELALLMGLSVRTWHGYENGVTVPSEVLLRFIEETGVNPAYLISGEGEHFRPDDGGRPFPDASPIELIREGLARLEATAEGSAADRVELDVFPLDRIGRAGAGGSAAERKVLAFREWIPNPSETIAVRLMDDAMAPILPAGSIAAVDRTLTEPQALHGHLVAARPLGVPMIRWLEISGRHMIFRPNNPSREFHLIPMEIEGEGRSSIIGRVVCSWSRFLQA